MDTKKIIGLIQSYATDDRQTDIDKLDGPYIAKGMYMDRDDFERLEVGLFEDELQPLIQLKLTSQPEVETNQKSYLDYDGFSGNAYNILPNEYKEIQQLVEAES